MFKVRFNLSRGANYKKWKITFPNGDVEYYCPNSVVLKMKDCKLYNNKKGALRIYNGHNKYVVSWIEAKDVKVLKQRQLQVAFDKVSYNPRVAPYWTINNKDVDNETFEALVTINNEVFLQ